LGHDVSKPQIVARLNAALNANLQQPFGGLLEQLKWLESLRKLFD
jgi:hypothetical protein